VNRRARGAEKLYAPAEEQEVQKNRMPCKGEQEVQKTSFLLK
jgi:hypothetical protein